MTKHDCIVLNSHGVGQYAYCDKMPVWGETLPVAHWHVAQDGGKGSNVAVALGRLGIDCAYIGKVGYDPWGDLRQKWMSDAGVDTTYLYRSEEVSTGTGLVLIGPDGQNSIIDGDSSSRFLTLEEVVCGLDNMRDSEWLITGFEIPYMLSLKAAKYAKSLGMKTALNPSPLPDKVLDKLDFIDLLFVNEIEASNLLETKCEVNDFEKIAFELKKQYGCKGVVLTLGDKGALTLNCSNNLIKTSAKKPDKIVNTAGAGDGFMAACIASLVKGKTLKDALEFASYYSALSIGIDGTIPAYRPTDEVEKFISCRRKQ